MIKYINSSMITCLAMPHTMAYYFCRTTKYNLHNDIHGTVKFDKFEELKYYIL